MAKQRIISSELANQAEEQLNLSLRPQRLDDYVGQPKLVEKLRITLQAVKERNEPMEHVLLHGPPGLGKTTLAHIIANEMETHLVVTSGPALVRPTDLVGTLTKLQAGDVLFIDEIHRLSVVVEEYIYPAMEDFKIEVTVDSGMHAKTITLPIKPFSLIGATTRAGLLSGPMRSRFGIAHNLEYYSKKDLLHILRRNAALLKIQGVGDDGDQDNSADGISGISGISGGGGSGGGLNIDSLQSLEIIASRARGTPRIANRLLRRVRDFSQVRANGRLTPETVDMSLTLEGIDNQGLDELDRKYLLVIGQIYNGGPVGLEAIAATLGEDSGTLEEVVEPYLLQLGFLARTRKGRELTQRAAEHVGIKLTKADPAPETDDEGLFEGE